MKKVLLGVVLCGVTSACMANEKTVKTNLDTKEQVCRFVLKLAGGVIQGKQNGVPISDVLEIKDKLRKNFGQDGELGEMAIQWVIEDAYKLPYYTDEESNKQQYNEFTASEYLGCLNMFDEMSNSNS